MSDYEYRHWFTLYHLRIFGYKKDDLMTARICMQIALSNSSESSRDLNDYLFDPLVKPEWEDEEYMDEISDQLRELENRAGKGEFDYMMRK